MYRLSGLLLAALFAAGQALGQPAGETGTPYILNFNSDDYGGHTQNYSAIQDNRGLIYVANFAGILEYDGTNWRLVTTKNTSQVISLAKDSSGRIYAGARDEFGYLAPDPLGQLVFVSLSSRINKEFNEVFATIEHRGKICFFTENYVFVWSDRLKIINPGYKIQSAFKVRDEIYLMIKGHGFAKWNNGSVSFIRLAPPAGKILDVTAMMPFGSSDVLFSSSSQGLFLIRNDSRLEQFQTDIETDNHLKTKVVSCGVVLPDSTIALGTERAGILIIGRDGTFRQMINKKNNLNSEFVTDLFIDKNNLLWAVQNNGISLIDIPSRFSYFDENSGLGSGVLDILRQKGTLYVADYKGMLYYKPDTRSFHQIPEITTAVWSLSSTPAGVIAGTSKGVYKIAGNSASKIADGFVLKLLRSGKYANRYYVCRTDGLFMLENDGGNWEDKGRVAGIEEEIRNIAEDSEGNLWLATPKFGILKLDKELAKITRFDTSRGLSSLMSNYVYCLSPGVLITTDKDIRRYNSKSGKFEKFTIPSTNSRHTSMWFKLLVEDEAGNIWLNKGDETGVSCMVKTDSNYNHLYKPFLQISDFITWDIYPDSGDVVWFGGPEGLIKYDKKAKNVENRFETLIRKVTCKGDSVIFGGAFIGAGGSIAMKQTSIRIPELEYNNNSVKFEFSASFYHPNPGLQYQYYLKGFDKTWSEWSKNTTKEFTNLPSGSYVFQVRAKNIFGEVTYFAEFAFLINTPWYESVAAYIFYAVGLIVMLYYVVKLRSRKLIREKRFLEKLIEERTAEISRQKEELQNQSEQLAQKNSELEKINNIVKSINSEINIGSVLQTILEKIKLVRGIEKATALVLDKDTGLFRFKASSGWDLQDMSQISVNLQEIEAGYLNNTEEIYEDIFYSNNFHPVVSQKFQHFELAQSIIIIVVKVGEKTEGYLILENMRNKQAFKPKDLEFLKNLKEHVVSAFIKSKILEDLQLLLDNLRATQQQLIQTEKLASLGQLTAGIAHEIQNPLNFVNNFSKLTTNLAVELKSLSGAFKGKIDPGAEKEMLEIIDLVLVNSTKINEHGNRASEIVKGMLMHSRGDSGEFQDTDLNRLADEYFHLAFHGMRAEHKDFNTEMLAEYDENMGFVKVVPQDISRVIINIVNNACFAVYEKSKKEPPGAYKPQIKIKTRRINDKAEISVWDNGIGIPENVIDKICSPFFTTKPTGKGTGLGLSISHDIITQTHKGKLDIKSNSGEFSEFIITLPV